jgi:hypothetical protein
MKLYLSGPMTGLVNFNRPTFHVWAARLRRKGYEVSNPADLPAGWDWARYMDKAEDMLRECDGIALLPGFLDSKGARIELRYALDMGMPYGTVRNWEKGLVSMGRMQGALHGRVA